MDPYTMYSLISLGMQAYGAAKNASASGKMSAQQLAEQSREFNAQNATARDNSQIQEAAVAGQLSQQDPTLQQKKVGNLALFQAILPQLRNFTATAPTGNLNPLSTNMSDFTPQLSGGVTHLLPDGGIPQSVMDYFTPPSAQVAQNLTTRNLDIPGTLPRIVGGSANVDESSQIGSDIAAQISQMGKPGIAGVPTRVGLYKNLGDAMNASTQQPVQGGALPSVFGNAAPGGAPNDQPVPPQGTPAYALYDAIQRRRRLGTAPTLPSGVR